MSRNAAFRSTVCMYGLFGTSLRHKVWHMWECISCVYNTWAECMHIRTGNGRESTQEEQIMIRFLAVMLSTILSGTVGNL